MKKEMKECGCGILIPVNQDSCYGCWRRKDRKKNSKLYDKDRMFPANGRTPSTQGVHNHTSYFYKDLNKDFTVDDLPVPEPNFEEEQC